MSARPRQEKARRPSRPRRYGELPTPERLLHDPVRVTRRAVTDAEGNVTGTVRGARVMTTSVLDRLSTRRLISRDQWRAGRHLYHFYFTAGLEPSVVLRLREFVSGAGGFHPGATYMSERQLEAKEAFAAAMKAVGVRLNDLLFDVACADHSLGRCEFSRGWREGTGLVVLRIALDRLIEHFEPGAAARAGIPVKHG